MIKDGQFNGIARAIVKEVACAAVEGFENGLNDGVSFSECCIDIRSSNAWIVFTDDFKGRTLIEVRRKPGFDVKAMMYVAVEEAADLLRNLSADEIEDYIVKANEGKNPAITDYVEEVV